MSILVFVLGDPCSSFDCGSHGSCVPVNMTPTCVCSQGYVALGSFTTEGARVTTCVEPELAIPDSLYDNRLPELPADMPGGMEVSVPEPASTSGSGGSSADAGATGAGGTGGGTSSGGSGGGQSQGPNAATGDSDGRLQSWSNRNEGARRLVGILGTGRLGCPPAPRGQVASASKLPSAKCLLQEALQPQTLRRAEGLLHAQAPVFLRVQPVRVWHERCCTAGMSHLTVSLLALLATSAFVSPALAEPAVLSDQGSDQVQGTAPGDYTHDGFYLRLGIGFGAFGDALTSKDQNADDEYSQGRVTGVASVGELMLGGALTPQWIVGGGLWTSSVLASDFSQQEGDRVPSELSEPDNFTLIGPFADWYLGSKPVWGSPGSFHLQFGAALAVLNGWHPEEERDDDERRVAVGGGFMFGAGYEWWVDRQWALGALGRVTAAALVEKDSSDDYWYHGVASFPELLFTATYN